MPIGFIIYLSISITAFVIFSFLQGKYELIKSSEDVFNFSALCFLWPCILAIASPFIAGAIVAAPFYGLYKVISYIARKC